ncbi:hypothetical protein SDRG_15105 [Saprolegnia diclina VS20]|uniref:Spindle pole body component n=1 Tax=Saprolegnia diclina (strain VS20) TaxID=1156394 RepID=T0RBZ8_SAPDV|nr:hypothetical protein SDRG_15105 [Saprolegnia diclina VS20]EQC27097.1 hypothetical protein SDRG_15105 [Saprolegnia diclina VS20]|eukprot:XP_008619491.1 hypothetical protein SDRG_15105 [Saprolegnia diclina VS20]
MHHEVFLALIGVTGEVVVEEPSGESFLIDANYCPSLLSVADRAILLQVLRVGHAYKHIAAFAAPLAPVPAVAASHSLYRHALQHAIGTVLREYERHIAELEAVVLSKASTRTLPLAYLQVELATELDTFPFLLRLIQQVRTLRGKDVLELIKAHETQGIPSLQQVARRLLTALHRVLFRQMLAWMVSGSNLVDPYEEFFIVADASSFALALARAPLRYWPATVCEDVLFVGNAMRTVRETSLVSALALQADIAHLLQTPPDVWDSFAFASSVSALRAKVASELYMHVLSSAKFVPALYRMKAFFLCGDGALFNALLEAMDPIMRTPPHARSETDLHHGLWAPLLRQYDTSMRTDDDDDADKYFIALKVPVQNFDTRTFSGLVSEGVTSDAGGLECSGPTYGIGYWPHAQYVQGSAASISVTFSIASPMTSVVQGLSVLIADTDAPSDVAPPSWTPTSGLAVSGAVPTLAVEVVLATTVTQASMATSTATLRVLDSKVGSTPLFRSAESIELPMSGIWTLDVAFTLCLPTRGEPGMLLCVRDVSPVFEIPLPRRKEASPVVLGLGLAPAVQVHHWSFATAPVADPWRYVTLMLTPSPSLRYRQLLFPSSLLKSYADVFRVFFRLKRLLYTLNHLNVAGVHRDCLTRHEMTFVLHHLLLYFHVSVVEASFETLLATISATTDFDVVQRAHATFVAGVGKKCFVHATAVMAALDRVLETVGRFVQAPSDLLPTFRDHCRLLFTVLNQTNARELMAQLDFNGYVSSLVSTDRRA